jgi:hypothetical protein
MIECLIDSDTNTFILFNDLTGEIVFQEKITKPKKQRKHRKKSFKDKVHEPMLTLFSATMSRNEYSMFIRLLDYLTPEGELNMKLADIASLEDFNLSSLKNMVSKYHLKDKVDRKFMKYLITKQKPKVYF